MKRFITVRRTSAGTIVTVKLVLGNATVSDTVKTHLMGVDTAVAQAEANARRALEQVISHEDKHELEPR